MTYSTTTRPYPRVHAYRLFRSLLHLLYQISLIPTTLHHYHIRRNTAHTFGTFVTFESVESAESVKVLDTFSRQVPLTFDTFKKDKRASNTFKRDKSS